jgi:hypothetical protein
MMRGITVLDPNGKPATILVTPTGEIVTTNSPTVPAGSVPITKKAPKVDAQGRLKIV